MKLPEKTLQRIRRIKRADAAKLAAKNAARLKRLVAKGK